MSCQITTLGESFVAAWVGTQVGLLTSMGSQVSSEIKV